MVGARAQVKNRILKTYLKVDRSASIWKTCVAPIFTADIFPHAEQSLVNTKVNPVLKAWPEQTYSGA